MSRYSRILLVVGCSTRPAKDEGQLRLLKQEFARQSNAEYDATLKTTLRRMELEVANADILRTSRLIF